MAVQEFIFSDAPGIKVRRHLLFWIFIGLGYFIQSILIIPHFLLVALCSMVFFFPQCVIAFYVCINYLLPRFFRRKNYILFGLDYLLLISLCFGVNYVCSVLFYQATNLHPIHGFRFSWYFSLANINSMHLVAITGLGLGIGLAKRWYLEQKENLVLFKENIRREVRLQKSKAYPEVIKKSLTTLSNNLRSGNDGSPDLLMAISDVFSYLLYSVDDGEIEVKKEINILKKIAYLENSNPDNPFLLSLGVVGEVDEGLTIPPLAIFSILQCAIAVLNEQGESTNELQLDVGTSDHRVIVSVVFYSLYDPETGHIEWAERLKKKIQSTKIADVQLFDFEAADGNSIRIMIRANSRIVLYENSASKTLTPWQ